MVQNSNMFLRFIKSIQHVKGYGTLQDLNDRGIIFVQFRDTDARPDNVMMQYTSYERNTLEHGVYESVSMRDTNLLFLASILSPAMLLQNNVLNHSLHIMVLTHWSLGLW